MSHRLLVGIGQVGELARPVDFACPDRAAPRGMATEIAKIRSTYQHLMSLSQNSILQDRVGIIAGPH
ncbi:hypothetical protein RLDS_25265 [Sphingobium lactosutens DS20]|uniref:Uncharacterized protein n=1 Tax=Sphingobium lactosutens DS20 TaxID=1331060 RepID=T0HCN7_9SPHN|nr:hypothetical protein RLDS_25265 [Sphingobium lactosutens DS20]